MVFARRAPVKPRVLSPDTGEALPLEDELRPWLDSRRRGRIAVIGPPGSGKTTALEHLAAVLPTDFSVSFWDDSPNATASLVAGPGLVVYAAPVPRHGEHLAVLTLAPWNLDDALEYLLTVDPAQTASVLRRLRASPDRDLLNGTPELWRIVLDQMADDETVIHVSAAFRRYFASLGLGARVRQLVQTACLTAILDRFQGLDSAKLRDAGCPEAVLRLIRHGTVQVALATEKVAADLHAGGPCDYFKARMPLALVRAIAPLVLADPTGLEHLHRLLADFALKQPMAASILHAMGTGWRPPVGHVPALGGAWLPGADWPGLNFDGVSLAGADLSGANLAKAVLVRVTAFKANFARAYMREAALGAFNGSEANFTLANLAGAHGDRVRLTFANFEGANLEGIRLINSSLDGANLTRANFRDADLSNTRIRVTQLEGGDFTGANLQGANLAAVKLRNAIFSGACFSGANLYQADLEGMQLPLANFASACLESALLTGASMAGANLSGASLCDAGLADVDWEGADLKNADLRGATFHLGSSRSGRVDSYIASEGTRMGFYTDDYEEQYFKAPEEIRKANLSGADLRGARIDGVDFYLVDVRGALYDPDQEQHLRRCRAILGDRDDS
jgi:uncharacterized protein YjbI with pentapeptide repeats